MWHVRNDVLKESRSYVKIGKYKNGKTKLKKKHKCAGCEKLWNDEQVEVDHIIEVGNSFGCGHMSCQCDTQNL